MKTLNLIPLVSLLFMTGCAPKYFYQLYNTTCENCIKSEESYRGGNDSVMVEYQFWGEDGVMRITVHNKMTRSIYIDWKKSGFYRGSDKLNYFFDSEKGVNVNVSAYGGYRNAGNQPVLIGSGQSKSVTFKEERMTYVVSQSEYRSSPYTYYILPSEYLIWEIIPKSIDTIEKTQYKVYTQSFNRSSSPLIFRNYITWTFSENNQEEGTTIDNTFYISEVKEVSDSYFGIKYNDFMKNQRFYKIIKKRGHSLEDRENGVYPSSY